MDSMKLNNGSAEDKYMVVIPYIKGDATDIAFNTQPRFRQLVTDNTAYLVDVNMDTGSAEGMDILRQALIPREASIIGFITDIINQDNEPTVAGAEYTGEVRLMVQPTRRHKKGIYPKYIPRLAMLASLDTDPMIFCIDVQGA